MDVLGEVNTTSNTSSGVTTPWRPFLVAADQVMLLSNNWKDDNARWNYNTNTRPRTAVSTTYNMEILAGWAESGGGQYSGGVENFVRFLENWGGRTATIRGSFVIGFDSVYYHWRRHCCNSSSYNAPVRDWGFDEHLNSTSNQPPGSPSFTAEATRRWQRQ